MAFGSGFRSTDRAEPCKKRSHRCKAVELHLMHRCRDFVCSVSTLSWWGAWLNGYDDKVIVAPREWVSPGSPVKNNDICCEGWIALSICRYLIDAFPVRSLKGAFQEKMVRKIERARNKIMRKIEGLRNRGNR